MKIFLLPFPLKEEAAAGVFADVLKQRSRKGFVAAADVIGVRY